MKKTKISIIVPVYNASLYLDECITSLLNQTYKNIEIILINDGSKDNSLEICKKFEKKDSRIKAIHQPNSGPSVARNEGLKIAKGEFISFVDSDDFIDVKAFEKIVEVFGNTDADIVEFDCNLISEKGQILGSTEKINQTILDSTEALKELILGNINNYACNKLYRRNLFDNIEFPEGYLWEDMGICYKLFLKARNVYCLPEKFYFYRQRKNSIVGTITDKAISDIFFMQMKRYKDLKSLYPQIAELGFFNVAIIALNLHDRSLWGNVDKGLLCEAENFLYDNKNKILILQKKRFALFFTCQRLYDFLRIIKHKIGALVKWTSKFLG